MRRYIVTHTDDRQLDPVVHAATATDTARRELEAKVKLFEELKKYWLSWPDQTLTLESQERCPCDLLGVFVEYAEGLCGARAASSPNSATSIEAYVELIEHSIVPGILNQILPDESLIIPAPEPIGVRCIETDKDRAKRHLWGRIIRFDQDLFDYDDCSSSPTIKEQPFCRDAQNRIVALAESPSGNWEGFIALTHRPFDPPSCGHRYWRHVCHPFQLTLRRFESRTWFKDAIQAHLALRIPDWSARFLKMIEARGTAVETDVPLATEAARAVEMDEDPLEFVERRLGELEIEWNDVKVRLRVSIRTVGNIKTPFLRGTSKSGTSTDSSVFFNCNEGSSGFCLNATNKSNR
jgi:hypothetical protein